MPRGEHAPLAPGVVRIRLESSDASADAIVTILRDRAGVEILTGPDRYSGGRLYLMVQVQPGEMPGGAS